MIGCYGCEGGLWTGLVLIYCSVRPTMASDMKLLPVACGTSKEEVMIFIRYPHASVY